MQKHFLSGFVFFFLHLKLNFSNSSLQFVMLW